MRFSKGTLQTVCVLQEHPKSASLVFNIFQSSVDLLCLILSMLIWSGFFYF